MKSTNSFVQRCAVFYLVVSCQGLVACGDGDSSSSEKTVVMPGALVETFEEAAGDHCTNGGTRIASGTDEDADGELDESEVTSTQYVCNGEAGEMTAASAATLTLAQEEPAGDNCANGGVALVTGIDKNGDSALSANEIQATRYVCKSSPGQLVTVSDAADACVNGGSRVTVGVDSDGDGTLSATEATSETLVCASANVLLTSTVVAPGDECPTGGTRVSSGADLNGDGILSAGEEQSTTVVCATAQTLVRTETATSEQCPGSGFVLYSGADTNGDGELGDSEVTEGQALCVASIQQIALYHKAVCAVLTDGSVYSWGSDALSQGLLGDAVTFSRATPSRIPGLPAIASVSLSGTEGHAVTRDGNVYCWGSGACATRAGSVTPVTPVTPVLVAGISDVEGTLTSGHAHTCGLTKSHQVFCWGYNASGQCLGGSATTSWVLTPTEVTEVSGAVAVEASKNGSCVVTEAGAVKCWGDNSSGSLGLGSEALITSPTTVSLPEAVSDLDLGGFGSSSIGNGGCAVLVDGRLYCWGLRTGNASSPTSTTPVLVELSGESAVAVQLALAGSCAETTLGNLYCWGSSGEYDFLQLGVPGNYTTPHLSSLAEGARLYTLGRSSVLAATVGEDGIVRMTGYQKPDRLVPTATPVLDDTLSFTLSGARGCAIQFDRTVRCWGFKYTGMAGTADSDVFVQSAGTWNVPALTGIAAIDPSGCAIDQAGKLYCWGKNSYGQVGNGTRTAQLTPVEVTLGGATAVDVSVAEHTCAVDSNGKVWCWGFNSGGELGTGDTTDQLSPTMVAGIEGVTKVVAGGNHTCALKSDSTVYCWGNTDNGQVRPYQSGDVAWVGTPTQVSGLSGVVAIDAADWWTCALTDAGQVYCWGTVYRLSTTDGISYSVEQGPVAGIAQATAISVDSYSACALESDGTLRCWGGNTSGQLGNGTTVDSFATAVAVSNLSNVTEFSVGYLFACAKVASGEGYCWGSDRYLCQGDPTSTAPSVVSGISDNMWSVSELP